MENADAESLIGAMTNRAAEKPHEGKDARGLNQGMRETITFFLSSAGVAVLGVMLLLTLCYGYYGDVHSGTERLRGHTVLIEDTKVSIDSVDHDSKIAYFSVSIKNLTSAPIKIIGYEVGCSCIHFENIPFTLRARETIVLNGKLHWQGEYQDDFEYVVLLFLDSGNSPAPFVVGAR